MPFERFLLLWDELDELAGGIYHGYLHLAHDVKGLRQDLADRLLSWTGSETAIAVLPEASPEG